MLGGEEGMADSAQNTAENSFMFLYDLYLNSLFPLSASLCLLDSIKSRFLRRFGRPLTRSSSKERVRPDQRSLKNRAGHIF